MTHHSPTPHSFQRFYFRNANHPIVRPSVTARRADRSTSIARLDAEAEAFERQNSLTISGQGPHAQGSQAYNARRSHIFDGKTLAKETAAFQLCDIEDPMLKGMIEDAEELREVCDDRDGWYTTHALERIKMVLRHKFFSLLEGHVASDEVSLGLLHGQGSLLMIVEGVLGTAREVGRTCVVRDALCKEARQAQHGEGRDAARGCGGEWTLRTPFLCAKLISFFLA